MQDLNPAELSTVLGGAKQTDQITQQITALQSSLKDAVSANNNNNGGNSNQTFMLLAMMMAMRPQPTVVAAGGPPPIVAAAAPGPVVNISTRVRHF
ncbi:MAG TPA: hypothetical protein VFD36_27620 [Kofleriaceae bacterium]|nr:hypothetical protein [Kofleriaceae bacterium]